MVTVRKSKLLSTSSAIQPNTYYYEFDVDTIAELPDPYYNGTIVAHGSKATIINSGEVYRINGDGEWKLQSTSGGGASLPDVTAEDNGDVLTVVDGAWDKATPNDTEKIVIFNLTGGNNNVYQLVDATRNDIETVISEGKIPVLVKGDANSNYSLVAYYTDTIYLSGVKRRRFSDIYDENTLGMSNINLFTFYYDVTNLTSSRLDLTVTRMAKYSDIPVI